jgi:hypothetical protein
MSHNRKPATPAPAKPQPSPAELAKGEKQKAEQQEVAGRHKNDGQIGHKGAR